MGNQTQSNPDFLDDFLVTIRKPKNDEDRPKLPELTWLPATIKQIKKKQLPKSQSIRAQFTFIISSGKYKDQYAWGSVPLHEEITEKADLYKWLCNILGETELAIDENVRIGDLVGRPVDIMVKNTKGTNGKIYQNVTEVRVQEAVDVVEEPKKVVKTAPPTTVKTPVKTVPVKKVVVQKPVEEQEEVGADLNIEETEVEPTEEISEDDLPF